MRINRNKFRKKLSIENDMWVGFSETVARTELSYIPIQVLFNYDLQIVNHHFH